MTRLGLFVLALLAVTTASAARADVPSPDGKYYPKPWGSGAPPPGWFEQNGLQNSPPNPLPAPGPVPQPTPAPQPYTPITSDTTGRGAVTEPPKRTGPFRSCGSGAGTGLAGIGAAWALLWLGNRFAGRITRRAKNSPAD